MSETQVSVKRVEGDKSITFVPRRGRTRPEHGSQPSPIRDRRQAAGLTLSQLAAKAGYSKAHLSMVEDGQHGASRECLRRLAQVLRCKISDLQREEDAA